MIKIKKIFKNKWFAVFAISVLIGIIVTFTLHGSKPNNTWRIVGLPPEITQRKVSDYSGSTLHLYNKTNTFLVHIKYLGKNEFMGMGTYTKKGKTYTFTYIDVYRITYGPDGAQMRRDDEFKNSTENFVVSKGKFKFRDVNGVEYHFKK